jgi:hypothetical protein
MPNRVAIPDPGHPGQLFIPALGRTFQQVNLVPFTYSWQLDRRGLLHVPAVMSDDLVLMHVGAKPGKNWQVWVDEKLEHGDHLASQLRVMLDAHEAINLSLVHLDYFWPQLHDLGIPVQWYRNHTLQVHGPPNSLVTISGLWKQDIR